MGSENRKSPNLRERGDPVFRVTMIKKFGKYRGQKLRVSGQQNE